MVPCMNIWVVLSFIVSIAASPVERPLEHPLEQRASSLFLGYKAVNEKRAKAYIAAGNTLIFDSTGSSDQLGPGQYISPTFHDWPGEWDCAILTSDPAAWNLANKMWVAATDGCDPPLPLWWNPGAPNRPAYMTEIGGSTCTTSNTILFSKIDARNYQLLQMLIPKDMLGSAGGLSIVTQCAARTDTEGQAAISAYGSADWYGWTNVKGVPQRY